MKLWFEAPHQNRAFARKIAMITHEKMLRISKSKGLPPSITNTGCPKKFCVTKQYFKAQKRNKKGILKMYTNS